MKRILIVDDQVEVRDLVEVTLRSDHYQILEAKNGQEAIDIARTNKPDLTIMDIMMRGGIDGFEATRIIKNDPETKECPIIILTAKGQEVDRNKGFAAGANGYCIKPFGSLELTEMVEEVLA